MKRTINTIKYKKGFTILETLVSISILVLIFTGPLELAFNMYKKFDFLQKKIIATNLAQEGLELIELYRANAAILCISNGDCDHTNMTPYWIDSNGFVASILARCSVDCALDTKSISGMISTAGLNRNMNYAALVPASNCVRMYIHNNGIYTCQSDTNMDGNAPTSFARYIKVERINDSGSGDPTADTELLVTSGVHFGASGDPDNRVELKTILKIISN